MASIIPLRVFARNLLKGNRRRNNSLYSMAILFTLKIFVRNLLRLSRRKNIFIFLFWCMTWGLNSSLTYSKPTYYLLHYVDSLVIISHNKIFDCVRFIFPLLNYFKYLFPPCSRFFVLLAAWRIPCSQALLSAHYREL